MTESQIRAINEKSPYNQGIFFQPNHVPVSIKEHVIYKRTYVGGLSGGNCWDDTVPTYKKSYEGDSGEFEVLDLVLEELKPDITYLQVKKIMKLLHTNTETEWEYYGNSSEYLVKYIILSELEKALKEL